MADPPPGTSSIRTQRDYTGVRAAGMPAASLIPAGPSLSQLAGRVKYERPRISTFRRVSDRPLREGEPMSAANG